MKREVNDPLDGFNWFVTQDRERWWCVYMASRTGAIYAGRQQFDGAFYICEARQHDLNLRIDHDEIFECLARSNEDKLDPEGDGGLFDKSPSAAQCEDLETRIEQTIRDWICAHGLSLKLWAFAEQRNEELIPDARDYPPDIREYYHALVARMGGVA